MVGDLATRQAGRPLAVGSPGFSLVGLGGSTSQSPGKTLFGYSFVFQMELYVQRVRLVPEHLFRVGFVPH